MIFAMCENDVIVIDQQFANHRLFIFGQCVLRLPFDLADCEDCPSYDFVPELLHTTNDSS